MRYLAPVALTVMIAAPISAVENEALRRPADPATAPGASTATGQHAAAFPYAAYVAQAGAEARSGPGEEFFATDRLVLGTRVTVYKEAPGGWLAIRPPAGSFSWVAASDVRLRNDSSLAEVIRPGARSWIGSALGAADRHSQVTLNRGEVLRVLGAKRESPQVGQSGSLSYQIAPPAGEFRWVAAASLSSTPPRDTGDGATGNVEPPRAAPARHENSPGADNVEQAAGGGAAAADGNPAVPGANQAEPAAVIPPGDTPEALALDLSRMVAGEPKSWRLRSLKARAAALSAKEQPPEVRGKAERLATEIAGFEAHRARLGLSENPTAEEVMAPKKQAAAVDAQPKGAARRAPAQAVVATSLSPAGGSPYDGEGVLARSVAQGPARGLRTYAPPFALTDGRGGILTFVTPAPGLNLNRFLGRKIGIYGQRGYLESYGKPHLVADKVMVVDRR